jgi:predicted CoA-binding protein
MRFANPSPDAIRRLLGAARTIAVVGLSDNPQRPSYEVTSTMLDFGYRIVPVNPTLAVWEGIRAFPDLSSACDAMRPDVGSDGIDIVNVFRRPEHIGGIVDDCIRLRLPALWLQLGVIDEAAALRAHEAGIVVVMDRCIKMERTRMG